MGYPREVSFPCPRRAAPQLPACPRDLPLLSPLGVLAQGLTQHASRSGALTKEPSPPWVARALLYSGTFSAQLFRGGARPRTARALARGPGQGAAPAQGTHAGDDPRIRVQSRDTAPLPTTPTKGHNSRPGRWRAY